MTDLPHITHCGLPGVDHIPFGMHACHFYSNSDELVAALMRYFIAGLRAKERCLWLTAPPLSAREAMQALRAVWDGIDDALHHDALRILDAVRLKGVDVVQLCLKEEERALAEGYNGLRIAGGTSFLASGMKCEKAMTAHFRSRRIIALCSYIRGNSRQMSEVTQVHDCALVYSESEQRLTMIQFPTVDRDHAPAIPTNVPLKNSSRVKDSVKSPTNQFPDSQEGR